jgi:uncharacterized protein (TIGR04255 family)
MAERRQYKNPPIVEAVCEIRTLGALKWGIRTPVQLLECLGDSYPDEPAAVIEQGLELDTEADTPRLALREGTLAVRFSADGGRRFVTFHPEKFSVHVLKPYPGWESFRESIEEALSAHSDVFGRVSVNRIGIRYINRIGAHSESMRLGTYLTKPPQTSDSLDVAMTNFLVRVQSRFVEMPNTFLTHTLASQPEDPRRAEFLLDIDVYREYEPNLAVDEVLSEADVLRNLERDAFEEFITDQAREAFDE